MQHKYVKESHDYLIAHGMFPTATMLFDIALDNLDSKLLRELIENNDIMPDEYVTKLVWKHVEIYTKCMYHEDINIILELLRKHKFLNGIPQHIMVKWYSQCYDYDYIFLGELPKEYDQMVNHIKSEKQQRFNISASKLASIYIFYFSLLVALFSLDSKILGQGFVFFSLFIASITIGINYNETCNLSKSKLIKAQTEYIPLVLSRIDFQCKFHLRK